MRDETASNPNSPATCTPVTDGENVVAFFPDSGLFCYSTDGAEKWRAEVGPFHSMHGITGSPVLVDNLVVLQIDQLRGSELSAYDLASGELAWKVPRIDGLTGAYSTPSVLAGGDGPSLIVTSGPEELAGYLASTGEKVWSVPGVSNAPVTVPLVSGGPDHRVRAHADFHHAFQSACGSGRGQGREVHAGRGQEKHSVAPAAGADR